MPDSLADSFLRHQDLLPQPPADASTRAVRTAYRRWDDFDPSLVLCEKARDRNSIGKFVCAVSHFEMDHARDHDPHVPGDSSSALLRCTTSFFMLWEKCRGRDAPWSEFCAGMGAPGEPGRLESTLTKTVSPSSTTDLLSPLPARQGRFFEWRPRARREAARVGDQSAHVDGPSCYGRPSKGRSAFCFTAGHSLRRPR